MARAIAALEAILNIFCFRLSLLAVESSYKLTGNPMEKRPYFFIGDLLTNAFIAKVSVALTAWLLVLKSPPSITSFATAKKNNSGNQIIALTRHRNT